MYRFEFGKILDLMALKKKKKDYISTSLYKYQNLANLSYYVSRYF